MTAADGFPGLPGWGAKSAAAVLARYDHLEAIPADPRAWNVGVASPGKLAHTLQRDLDLALLFRNLSRCRNPSVSSTRHGDRVMAPLTDFYATIADVTNDQHENMAGLVQDDDFNADVVVRFLRANGIDAGVDEATGGFRCTAADPTRASHVRFACVCLRASISYAIEAAYWCIKAKR
ncbi:MAG: hypothetical protein M3N49_07500 [Candidatus Eremiobacteraeota bacterium]|nr:hypothetical protein [Candidatus Eremiobacteraeota bacterium]